MNNSVFVGTCSWTDKSLIASGEFYPKDVNSSEKRLRYYASIFPVVEVDSSFYAIPSVKNSNMWVERTPANFIFNFKAFAVMTGHSVKPESLPFDIRNKVTGIDNKSSIFIQDNELIKEIFDRFITGIFPILEAKKLGVVVFQYPPWFKKNLKNMDTILKAKELMKGINCAIEFRNRSWLEEDSEHNTLEFLRKNNLTYVISDAPQVTNQKTTRYLVDATTDIAYFRFHGRNITNWNKKGIETSLRYDYEYSRRELESFARDIILLKNKVTKVFAMFNNHRGSQAIRNALELMKILGE